MATCSPLLLPWLQVSSDLCAVTQGFVKGGGSENSLKTKVNVLMLHYVVV